MDTEHYEDYYIAPVDEDKIKSLEELDIDEEFFEDFEDAL